MKLEILKTENTPFILIDDKHVVIEGNSMSEDAIKFYKPILKYIENELKVTSKLIKIDVNLERFNTTSSKCLLNIFKDFENLNKEGVEIDIRWFYSEDNESMYEAGEDYKFMVNTHVFDLIEVL